MMAFRHTTHYTLDIGNGSLKLIRYTVRFGVPEVADARIHPLPLDMAGMQDDNKKTALWVEAIKSILQPEEALPHKEIMIALPGDHTFVRYITLPNIPVSKISKIIRFEAEQQIPFLLGDVEWSYGVIPARQNKEVAIVITAAKKQFIQTIIETVSAYGFRIRRIETGQLVLYNMGTCCITHQSGTVLVDIGARSTQVVILYKGMCWGRTLHLGAGRISREMATRLHLDSAEAERMKYAYIEKNGIHAGPAGSTTGPAAAQKHIVGEIIENVLYDIASEISRTMSYYLSIVRGAVFQEILLFGGGAAMKGIEAFFAKNLGIPARKADVRSCVRVPAFLAERFAYDQHVYHIAVGLAAGRRHPQTVRTNLLSEELRAERSTEVRKRRFAFSVTAIILIMITAVLNFQLAVLQRQREKDQLLVRVGHIETQEAKLASLEQAIAEQNALLELVAGRLSAQAFLALLIKDLERIVPPQVWFDFLEYDAAARVLILSGRTTETLAHITTFTNNVRGLPYVKDITFDTANIEEERAGGAAQRVFTIHVALRAPAEMGQS